MTRSGLRRSLGFDPQFLDDRPPFLGIGFPEGIQRFRGLALARLGMAKLGPPRAQPLICKCFHKRRIELADDLLRHVLGANSAVQPEPETEGNPISLSVGISGACASRA